MVKFIIKSLLKRTYFFKSYTSERSQYLFQPTNKNKTQIKKLIEKKNTPLFIGSKKIIHDRYQVMFKSLKSNWGPHLIGYSFKTNYSVIKDSFFKKNFWAEVVSEREYLMAKKNGYKNTIYNGPLKTLSSLKTAAAEGAIINIDNFSELKLIQKLTKKEKNNAQWGLRLSVVTPHLPGKSRFGFSIESGRANQALKAIDHLGLKLSGLHLHLGTDIPHPQDYLQASQKIAHFITEHDLAKKLTYLDFGGGYPAHGKPPHNRLRWKIPHISQYIEAITAPLKNLFDLQNRPKLILEPGRYLVDDAICLVSRVVNLESTDQLQKIIVDATSSMLPITHYRPQTIKVFTPKLNLKKNSKIRTVIYGASCQEDDVLFNGYLPKIHHQDYLIHLGVGAYNDSLGSNFIFNKPHLILI